MLSFVPGNMFGMCSTPEGIEAGRTAGAGTVAASLAGCSTPEGIEAGRTYPLHEDADSTGAFA